MSKYLCCVFLLFSMECFERRLADTFHGCSIGESLDCSRRKLTSVPIHLPTNTTQLDLSHNAILSIPNGVFRLLKYLTVLDLSHNNMETLAINGFAGLENLKVLDLSNNQLKMATSFTPGIFKNLKLLKVLKIYGTAENGSYPEAALKDLISLQELYMEGTNQLFGNGFTHLRNLTLISLGPLSCTTRSLDENTFEALKDSQIKELIFQRCDVQNIHENAFIHFPNLETFHLVCNSVLDIKTVLRAVSRIPGQRLETLVLDGTFHVKDNKFAKDTICDFHFSSVKRLSIRGNSLDYISPDLVACFPALEAISIGFNPMSAMTGPGIIFTPETQEYWMNSNMTELDSSYAFIALRSYFDTTFCPADDPLPTTHYFKNYQLKYTEEDLIKVDPPAVPFIPRGEEYTWNPKMKILHFDHTNMFLLSSFQNISFFCILHYSPDNDIRFLNASYNNFRVFTCEMIGVYHLQELDLSHCGMQIFGKNTLRSAPNLKEINLAGNELGVNDNQFEDCFELTTNLDSIILSDNNIKHLPQKTFTYIANLTSMDLSRNSLTELSINIKYNKKLERLDLSENLLPSLQTNFINELKERPQGKKPLEINLRGNPFQCDCDAIDFLNFIKVAEIYHILFLHLNEYMCSYQDGTKAITEVNIAMLEEDCKDGPLYTIIISTLSILVVMVIVIAIVVYRWRWKIAWKVYEMRRTLRQARMRRSFRIPVHKYKVFIAYATLDNVGLPFVTHELLTRVEQEWAMTAFILDRDAAVGPFLEEVTNSIKHSEKKLFVVTNDLKRLYQWPMALHWCVDEGLSKFILVLLDIKVRNLPPSLANVAKSRPAVQIRR